MRPLAVNAAGLAVACTILHIAALQDVVLRVVWSRALGARRTLLTVLGIMAQPVASVALSKARLLLPIPCIALGSEWRCVRELASLQLCHTLVNVCLKALHCLQ